MKKAIILLVLLAGVSWGAYNVGISPAEENCVQWKLNDSAASTAVVGNDVDGVMQGGNTSDVAATLNGVPCFHLNGSSQYVSVTLSAMWETSRAELWTKSASNPVLQHETAGQYHIQFGQVWPQSDGSGWWYFGAKGLSTGMSLYRWSSDDLITWTDGVEVLASGGDGAWDEWLQVCTVAKIPGGNYIMLYRGDEDVAGGGNGLADGNWRMGWASSADGTTWTRKNNGGTNDGLIDMGGNFDPVGLIRVGSTYYFYTNGDGGHGITDLYTSTDMASFTEHTDNLFTHDQYCGQVFYYQGYYYLLLPWDRLADASGTTLYDHGLGLWRSRDVTFPKTKREFLGFPIVNDQPYDVRYVDTPTFAFTDVYKTAQGAEFGNVLQCLYTASACPTYRNTLCLATTTFSELANRKPKLFPHLSQERVSFSFWVQFDTLTAGDAVFAVGDSITDSSPQWLLVIRASGSNKVLSSYRLDGGGYENGQTALAADTPYHIVVSDDGERYRIFINGTQDGFDSARRITGGSNYNKATSLFIGAGYNSEYLDGYIWDFRIYPYALTLTEANRLYRTGSAWEHTARSVSQIAGLKSGGKQ